jgi:two-component system, chemotaxis family, protein-glutamate methylesterase/glutaminase
MPIRVLLVEDSQIALVILKRILNSSPQIEVVGEARTGLDALALIPEIEPDVICTDLYMPKMDGLTFTSEVMARYPRPILVISASVQEEDAHHVFQLLEAGAVDIFPKPLSGLELNNASFKEELINKVKILSGVKVITRRPRPLRPIKTPNPRGVPAFPPDSYTNPKIVTIGASTGGPSALYDLFAQLPANFPVPVICVQHICFGFLQGLIDWLAAGCALPIAIAQPGEMPRPGRIYFPPERYHLELDPRGRFVCSDTPPLEGHRPSVTLTFTSVVKIYGKGTVGILLTGMGRDGAEGMLAIAEAGGFTIAQDEATSVVFGMPREAINLGAARQVLPMQAIAPTLLNLFQLNPPNTDASHSATRTNNTRHSKTR